MLAGSHLRVALVCAVICTLGMSSGCGGETSHSQHADEVSAVPSVSASAQAGDDGSSRSEDSISVATATPDPQWAAAREVFRSVLANPLDAAHPNGGVTAQSD